MLHCFVFNVVSRAVLVATANKETSSTHILLFFLFAITRLSCCSKCAYLADYPVLHSAQCILPSAQCIVDSTQCIVQSAQCNPSQVRTNNSFQLTCSPTTNVPMYQCTNTPDVDAPNAQLPDALDPSSKFGAHPLRICTPTSPNLVPAILYISVVATILEEYANPVLSASTHQSTMDVDQLCL